MNQNVRVERGEGGTIVVMSAFCPKCEDDAMPMADGTCSFCGTPIVDEETLPMREMLEQLGGPPARPQRRLPDGSPATHPEPPQTERARGGRRREWTEEKALAAIREVSEKVADGARSPTHAEMKAAGYGALVSGGVSYLGSWASLVAKAGYETRSRGGRAPVWTEERALQLLREQSKDGVAPSRIDFMHTAGVSNAVIVRLFGSYTDMVEAAGLIPKLAGRYDGWSPEKSDPAAPTGFENALGRSIVVGLRAAADALEQELGLQPAELDP